MCLIAQGEDIHVAVFPGAFELHTGPQLEEPEQSGGFACARRRLQPGALSGWVRQAACQAAFRAHAPLVGRCG